MKIVVVEPHADDAFLSLGWHLENLWREHERRIVTVYCDERRASEGEAYARAIGASYDALELPESPMLSAGPIRRIDALGSFLERLEWDRLIFPLGLQHPDHRRVAVSRLPGVERYLDTPYQAKQKLLRELAERAEGFGIASICFPSLRKWRHIPLFKSQAKFFHFNEGLKTSRLAEIILRNVNEKAPAETGADTSDLIRLF